MSASETMSSRVSLLAILSFHQAFQIHIQYSMSSTVSFGTTVERISLTSSADLGLANLRCTCVSFFSFLEAPSLL